MKKTLIIAALLAASSLAATPTLANHHMTEAVTPDAVCFALPLLPDCAAQWHDYWQAKGYHVKLPVEWWTCVKADADAGHLLECESD